MTIAIAPVTSAGLSDNELVAVIAAANREMSRQHARFLLNLAEFDERGLALECGAKSTAAWIVRSFDVADNTAYDYLRVARTAATFQYVADSFQSTRINYSKVRLLGRYLTVDNEIELVLLAESMSYRELERALAGRPRAGDEKDGPRVSRLRIWVDKDTGWIKFAGELGPADGQKLLTALKIGELASVVDLDDVDPEVLASEEKLSEAVSRAEEQPVAVEAQPVDEPSPLTGTSRFGLPMPSKLMSSFLSLLNIVHCSPANSRRAPGAQVQVLVTEDGHAHLPANPAAASGALSATVLNGYLRGHLLDSKGVTMKFGRAKRLVSDHQALAVLAAWQFQCAMPGCNHSRFIEFHHIVEWVRGGLTNPENLLPLCSFCHSMVTNGQVTVEPDLANSARLIFNFRDGSQFLSENRSLPLRTNQTSDAYLGARIPEVPEYRVYGPDGWLGFDDEE